MACGTVRQCTGQAGCAYRVLDTIAQRLGLTMEEQIMQCCPLLGNGFGIGEMCGAVVAGVMAIGIAVPQYFAKMARLQFLSEFHEKYRCFNCCYLSRNSDNCDGMIEDVCNMLEKIIMSYREK